VGLVITTTRPPAQSDAFGMSARALDVELLAQAAMHSMPAAKKLGVKKATDDMLVVTRGDGRPPPLREIISLPSSQRHVRRIRRWAVAPVMHI